MFGVLYFKGTDSKSRFFIVTNPGIPEIIKNAFLVRFLNFTYLPSITL